MKLKPKVPKPTPQSKRVGYALVGIGKLTVNELIPAARTSEYAYVAALVTGEEDKGEDIARAFGLSAADVYTYDEFEQLAGREDVEAVFIVLPNAMHREFTERAAKMGKHVLCEKPLATNAKEAQKMVDACKKAGVLLMTAYRCQYTPEHWRARETVQGGKIGNVKVMDSIHVQVQDENWRFKKALAGGGPLPDIGLYSLNILRFVTGLEPEWVFAVTHHNTKDPKFSEVEESMTFMLGFPGGVIGNVLTSYNAVKTSTLRVMGDKGAVFMDPAFSYEGLKLSIQTEEGTLQPQFVAYDQFTLEFDHFAQCIRQGTPPWTPGEEGVADHLVMDALYKSARTGQVVKLKGSKKKDATRGPKKPQMPKLPVQ